MPRIGTLPLAVVTACDPPSRDQTDTVTGLARPPVSRRQVLLFHASAYDELTPPIHRTPPGQQAGRPLAHSTPPRPRLHPGRAENLRFRCHSHSFDASAVVHPCSSSRRVPDPLTAGLLRSRFPPRLLTGMTLRRFGLSVCSANPEDLPPSLAQHGPCWRSSTSSSLSFQDTPRHECGSI